MYLTNTPNGVPGSSSYPTTNNGYGTSNSGPVIQGRPVGGPGFNTYNNGGTNRSGVCFNCGKAGHFARDRWAGRGRTGQPNNFDPELEEIKEQHRIARKEKQEMEERRKIEEDKKAREEEQARRDQDFARKAEEFKLQIRAELHEEWRKKKTEVEAATRESAKERRSPTGWWAKKLRRSRRKKRANKRYITASSESDISEDSEQSESYASTTESELTTKRRSTGKGRKRLRMKTKADKVKMKGRAKMSPLNKAPGVSKGECSKQARRSARGKACEDDSDEQAKEPRTPLTAGYKGLSAECSQKGIIDCCISAQKIYSTKKAIDLRKICDKKGIKYTRKPEIVELLARQQVELAYEGCGDLETNMEEEADTITASQRKTEEKGKQKMETLINRRTRVTLKSATVQPEDDSDRRCSTSSEARILARTKEEFLASGLHTFGPWKRDGRLGNAYVIPKHKDLNRWRPIAPAPADPASLTQRRTARALHYLLMGVPVQTSFYLNLVSDLADRLKATTHRLKAEECEQAVGRCYDIKEMFSHIPHDAVLQSAHQLLRRFEDADWKQVKVSFRGRACILSKTARKQDGYVSMKLKDLLKTVGFDLQHSFIKCGTKVMRQIFGISMGKSTSPVLASITCAMAEGRFLRALGTDRRLVAGWRIMDDISLVAGVPSSGCQASFLADFFNLFESSYDPSLKIVRKDECGLTWDFVGGTMMIGSKPLQLHYIPRSKNTDSLHETGKLEFQTLQDYSSYSDKKVKKAVL
ncbi:hypothetical protein CBR_g54415 [Chara braunii]|uniref:CCHC-type domain-containing protein n=1 Tax=Chara braunii TaxID=69332 RepID=A0A388MC83_CHABU|nr:hypothetical protein CBR_g54415 [Chara braunii]|eukprot:GBG92115.1 hypothetical protein CBR_g54415 [Chara braunii]